MADPAEVIQKDAEEGVLVVRTILRHALTKEFIGRISPIFQHFENLRDEYAGKISLHKKSENVTEENIAAMAHASVEFERVNTAFDVFRSYLNSYQRHMAAWGVMQSNTGASAAECFAPANLGKVRTQAYQVLFELYGMLEAVQHLTAVPQEDRNLAFKALAGLQSDVRWELAAFKSGAASAPTAGAAQPQTSPATALMRLDAASAAAEVAKAKEGQTAAADPAKPHRFSVVSSASPAAGSMVAMGKHQPGHIGLRKGLDGQVIVNTQCGEPKTP